MKIALTEEDGNRFLRCSCGSRQPLHKMQSVNNELLCKKCAKIAETQQKRKAKYAEDYQATVVLLDGTRLFYQPMEVNA